MTGPVYQAGRFSVRNLEHGQSNKKKSKFTIKKIPTLKNSNLTSKETKRKTKFTIKKIPQFQQLGRFKVTNLFKGGYKKLKPFFIA